jgi:hypothetical protein
MVLQVLGEIDGGHAPAAELTLDAVTLAESRSEAIQLTGHAVLCYMRMVTWQPEAVAMTRDRWIALRHIPT